jgi:hypothetical protein
MYLFLRSTGIIFIHLKLSYWTYLDEKHPAFHMYYNQVADRHTTPYCEYSDRDFPQETQGNF